MIAVKMNYVKTSPKTRLLSNKKAQAATIAFIVSIVIFLGYVVFGMAYLAHKLSQTTVENQAGHSSNMLLTQIKHDDDILPTKDLTNLTKTSYSTIKEKLWSYNKELCVYITDTSHNILPVSNNANLFAIGCPSVNKTKIVK